MSPESAPPSPDDDTAALAGRLRIVIARLNRQLRQQSALDLTPTKVAHLATIAREGPLSLGELAAAERVAPATVTKVVAELERRGFISRTRDAHDRRITRVALTDEGEERLNASRTRRSAWMARRLSQLDPDELARLAAAADVLEHLAESDPNPDPEPNAT